MTEQEIALKFATALNETLDGAKAFAPPTVAILLGLLEAGVKVLEPLLEGSGQDDIRTSEATARAVSETLAKAKFGVYTP